MNIKAHFHETNLRVMKESLFVVNATTGRATLPLSVVYSLVVRLVNGKHGCVNQHANGHCGEVVAKIVERHPVEYMGEKIVVKFPKSNKRLLKTKLLKKECLYCTAQARI